MIDKLKDIFAFLLRQDKNLYGAFASITSLRIVEKLCGLAISVLIFRFLSKEEVASYGYIQSIVALCAICGIQELQNTISQSVSRGFQGTYLKSIPVTFVSSFVGSCILCAFSYWYFLSHSNQMAFGFLIAAVVFPFFQGLRQWRGLYLGQKKFTTFSKAEAINAVIKVVLIVGSIYLFPHEIIWPTLVFMGVPAIQNIVRTALTVKEIPKDAPYEDGSLSYGFNANVYSATGTIASQIDKVILFAFLPPASLALYMAAEKFSDLLQGVVQDMAAVLAPKFAVIGNYSSALDKKLKLLALFMGAGILGFAFLILPYLLPLVFGASYHDSVFFSQILICGAAVRNIATLRFRFIRSKIDEKSFRQITVYSSIAHIMASIILIPLFGLYGAVAAVFLQRMTVSLIVDHIIKSRYLAHER